ncbi:DNA primase [Mycoplasma sp. 3341]|uniref:DNA primase n=1 Tax=Mycoplasma sp. 3341 TaxID=3447506 RepID=UPI003F655CD0
MQANNQSIWKDVVDKTNIVDVIGEYVALTKKGTNYTGLCPFHGEKTPSFVVSEKKQFFKCFGCSKSGNVIKFIEYIENIKPFEALTKLAKKVSVDVSQFQKYEYVENLTDAELLAINNDALNFFQRNYLKEKKKNNISLVQAIKNRHLEDLTFANLEIINHFKVGFAPSDISIYDELINRGYDEQKIVEASLISSRNVKQNFFNNRIIFPIFNDQLQCVGFSGRTIDAHDDVKYLNTSENSIFHKNSLFFNWQNVKNNLIRDKKVYLVEGQFDVIALYRVKIINALAVMGTALSSKHLQMLRNCHIVLFFDGDKAGQNATIKNLKIILQNKEKFKLNVGIIENITKKDPDELYFSLPGGKNLVSVIEKEISYLDYIYAVSFGQIDATSSLEQKQEAISKYQDFYPFLSEIDREYISQKAKNQFQELTKVIDLAEQEALSHQTNLVTQDDNTYQPNTPPVISDDLIEQINRENQYNRYENNNSFRQYTRTKANSIPLQRETKKLNRFYSNREITEAKVLYHCLKYPDKLKWLVKLFSEEQNLLLIINPPFSKAVKNQILSFAIELIEVKKELTFEQIYSAIENYSYWNLETKQEMLIEIDKCKKIYQDYHGFAGDDEFVTTFQRVVNDTKQRSKSKGLRYVNK